MADIPGATQTTYTTPVTAIADHLTLFRCVVSNAAGSVTSAAEMLFVTATRAAPTSIDSAVTAAAQVGMPFTFSIVSSGGTLPVTYSASPLPAGLSLDPDTGLISGTPTEIGATDIAVTAGNSAGSISAFIKLTVQDTPPAVSWTDWLLSTFGASATDPAIAGDAADPDGDGYTNHDEFLAGTNPLDPISVPVTLTRYLSKPVRR